MPPTDTRATDSRFDPDTGAAIAEVGTFADALEAGYLGHAPGRDNDHTVAGVTSTAPGAQPAGEPTGAAGGTSSAGVTREGTAARAKAPAAKRSRSRSSSAAKAKAK
jgi:hypothetical protein